MPGLPDPADMKAKPAVGMADEVWALFQVVVAGP
jgi:hypothetical protein